MTDHLLCVTTRDDFAPGAEEIFMQHGCIITKHDGKAIVTFPEGTIKEELYPRTTMEKNKILLPDGWCLKEIYNHYNGTSCLGEVPAESIPTLITIQQFTQAFRQKARD